MRFNLRHMREICQANEAFFSRLPDHYGFPKSKVVKCKNGLKYRFIDNGADILAIAHLDSVAGGGHFDMVDFAGKRRVFSPNLDDRLGAYVIIDLLPKYGVKYDLLLTTGEERGMDTAQFFKSKKQYKWMFEFDRTGTDAVMYMYKDPETTKLVESYGWDTAHGSMSDISYLEQLGCKGFNFGVGYHDYHSVYAYADLPETAWSVQNFLRFYAEQKDTFLPHVKTPAYTSYRQPAYGQQPVNQPFGWDDDYYPYPTGSNFRSSGNNYTKKDDEDWKLVADEVEDQVAAASKFTEIAEAEIVAPKVKRASTMLVAAKCEICKQYRERDEYLLRFGICSVCASAYKEERTCTIPTCDRKFCKGIETCPVCKHDFHGNITLELTGICSLCIDSQNDCVLCDQPTSRLTTFQGERVWLHQACEDSLLKEETNVAITP